MGIPKTAKIFETVLFPAPIPPVIPILYIAFFKEFPIPKLEISEEPTKRDIVEAADALADLQYVLSGAILEFGLGSSFKNLFDEVQRSNMSKVCDSLDDANATLDHYLQTKGTEGEIIEKSGQYLVYRKSDRKVLKSISYSEARLKEIIAGHATKV
ncbi:MAG: nucleoside triphosphate pyrophosphohydrolase family protein [Saprospiraceae bacterium]|nr:nucleoside triphosphate pyrophosphohydrolase family protein [Saprospiraceae bacterium]